MSVSKSFQQNPSDHYLNDQFPIIVQTLKNCIIEMPINDISFYKNHWTKEIMILAYEIGFTLSKIRHNF